MLRLELILTIKGGFCCNIVLLIYDTALKFLTTLNFLIAIANALIFELHSKSNASIVREYLHLG